MNKKHAGTFIAFMGLGIAAGAGVYAFDKYREQQAFEALLKDCGSCSNRHSAHLRNKAWEEQLKTGEVTIDTQDTEN